MSSFEPKLLGFLCNWCAYAGADLAGISRFQYPSNLRIIRVMCSGRVDPILIFQSLKEGIDGVAVLGCHPGDCHYQTGNFEAEHKMKMTINVLKQIGIDPERLYLDWVSAAEGKRFSEVVTNFTNHIRALGPISNDKKFKEKLMIGEQIVSSERLRWLIGKQRELTEKGNVYAEKVDENKFETIIKDNIFQEFINQQIFSVLKDKPQTIQSIASTLKIPSQDILKRLLALENNGCVNLVDFKHSSPRYILNEMEEEV